MGLKNSSRHLMDGFFFFGANLILLNLTMLWHIVFFHCVTIYWLASGYSTSFKKYTMGTNKRKRN
jgi:hypothetical protein